MKRRTFLLHSAAAGLGLALHRASAQEAAIVYDVELVAFQNLNPGATPEDWALEASGRQQAAPVTVEGEETSVVAAAGAGALPSATRQILPRDRFRMNAIAGSLERSRNYRPLAHFGWSQVGSPLNAAVAERLDAFLPSGTLSGSAALARGRYLHLTLDLDFRPDGQEQHYVLRQTRRMRSTERHYFDHPQFGVIALVTPQNAAR
jgi:hypothetical protein